MKYINVYEVDRAYGGPEEGGWWYDTGTYEPERSIKVTPQTTPATLAAMVEVIRLDLHDKADEDGVPGVGTSQYRGGRYTVRVEDKPGSDYPAERPTYQ